MVHTTTNWHVSSIFRWCDSLNTYTSCTSMSSLKNGKNGNTGDWVSFFITFITFWLISLTSILFELYSEIFPLLSRPAKLSKHIPSSYIIFKNVHVTLCLFLLSSILLPNRRLPTETPTRVAHILLLIQDFAAPHFRLLRIGLSIMFIQRTEWRPRLTWEVRECCPELGDGSWSITVR